MFLIFLQKTFQIFRKWNFLVFWEKYIQNPSIFRTKGIFRIRGILRKLSNIYDGTFCKNSSKNKKSSQIFLYFEKLNFLALIVKHFLYFYKRKLFLYFRKRKPQIKFCIFQEAKLCSISRNRNPKKLLMFSEVTLRSQKMKKKTLLKSTFYFGKWTCLYLGR